MSLPIQYGYFENPQGYELVKLRDEPRRLLWLLPLPSKAIYEFKLKDDDPLAFVMPDGTKVQPDRHEAETDMGSIPPAFQIVFRKDRFLKSYIFHDSGYVNHGLYFKAKGQDEYEFVEMSRLEVDAMLQQMIYASGGNMLERHAIYRAVRMGGGIPWKGGKTPTPKVCVRL